MKHFIVEIIFTKPMEKVEPVVSAHREFLNEGYQKKMLLFSGPQVPRVGGLLVAKAESLNTLQEYFAKDPYNKTDVARYRYIEFNPVKSQDFMKEWI